MNLSKYKFASPKSEEAYYSNRPCDAGANKDCSLAGQRYDVSYRDKDNNICVDSLCVDCYLKLFC